ncbi:MAG: toxin-antitoxin system YwqK family antitoxin [Flavobacteriales bacterium]
MKLKYVLILLLFAFAPATSLFAQGDQEMIEEKPANAPSSDRDHRNKKDLAGKKWGLWKFYSVDKVLILEIEYNDGQRHGKYARYNAQTGKPLEVMNYFYGVRDGTYQKYYPSGEIRVEGEYENGLKKGTWTYYYKGTGTTKAVGEFVKGLKEGEWKYYDKKENLIKTEVYKNGKLPEKPKEEKKDDKTKKK